MPKGKYKKSKLAPKIFTTWTMIAIAIALIMAFSLYPLVVEPIIKTIESWIKPQSGVGAVITIVDVYGNEHVVNQPFNPFLQYNEGGLAALASMTVGGAKFYDTASGSEGSINCQPFVKIVIEKGTPKSYNIQSKVKVFVDNQLKDEIPITTGQQGFPSDQIQLGKIEKKGSKIFQDIGGRVPSVKETHSIKFVIDVIATVEFTESGPVTKELKDAVIGIINFDIEPESGSFTVETGGTVGVQTTAVQTTGGTQIPLHCYLTPSPTTIFIGGSITYKIEIYGGQPPYNWELFYGFGTDSGQTSSNVFTKTYTYNVPPNTYTAILTVTDKAGARWVASASVKVIAPGASIFQPFSFYFASDDVPLETFVPP